MLVFQTIQGNKIKIVILTWRSYWGDDYSGGGGDVFPLPRIPFSPKRAHNNDILFPVPSNSVVAPAYLEYHYHNLFEKENGWMDLNGELKRNGNQISLHSRKTYWFPHF